MSKRLIALALGSGLAVAAACTFPAVDYAEEIAREDGGRDASSAEVGTTPVSPDVDPDGGDKDATSAADAAIPIDASGCTSCDCDLDGYNRVEPSMGCDGGGNGKAADCDDLINAIHPGMDFVIDRWPSSTHQPEGDWDCNGSTIRQYEYGAACDALKCVNGFVGNPPCGETAAYLTCNPGVLGLLCSEKTREPAGERTQGCH